MYVRTWYVQATGQTPVPQVNSVTISYEQSAFRGATLEDALNKAFGVNLDLGSVVGGTVAPFPDVGQGNTTNPTNPTNPTTPATTAPGGTTTPTTPATTTPGTPADANALLAQAQAAYDAAQAALKQSPPDIGTYTSKLNEAYTLAAQAASVATGQQITAVPPTHDCARRAGSGGHVYDRERLSPVRRRGQRARCQRPGRWRVRRSASAASSWWKAISWRATSLAIRV